MVHVMTPRPSIGSALGQALGSFVGNEFGYRRARGRFEEQQAQQLAQQQQQQAQQQSLLNQALTEAQQIYANPDLSPEQKQIGLFKALSARPEVAQALGKQLLDQQKAMQPKAPPGGLSGQSVPQDVSNAIQNVISSNPESTADQLALEMDKLGIPRAYSNSYIENRRRQEETSAKTKAKSEETLRKEQIEFHKESSKFDDKLTNESAAAEKKIRAIQKQREIQPTITNFDRIVSSAFKNTRFENLLKSKNAQEFDSLALPMVEGQKETFGVRLSDADLNLILQKIATAEKNPAANEAILNYMELEEKLKLEKRKIADEIKKNNKGLRPLDYESQIRQKMNEKFGNEIEESARKVLSLPDNERKTEMITGRKKVPQGTPLNKEIIDKYLDLSGNNIQEATKMALEDGYQF